MPENSLSEKHFNYLDLGNAINQAVLIFKENYSCVNLYGRKNAVLLYKSTQNTLHHRMVGSGGVLYHSEYLKIANRSIEELEKNGSLMQYPLHEESPFSCVALNLTLVNLNLGKIALAGLTASGNCACLLVGLTLESQVTSHFVLDILGNVPLLTRELYSKIFWIASR